MQCISLSIVNKLNNSLHTHKYHLTMVLLHQDISYYIFQICYKILSYILCIVYLQSLCSLSMQYYRVNTVQLHYLRMMSEHYNLQYIYHSVRNCFHSQCSLNYLHLCTSCSQGSNKLDTFVDHQKALRYKTQQPYYIRYCKKNSNKDKMIYLDKLNTSHC